MNKIIKSCLVFSKLLSMQINLNYFTISKIYGVFDDCFLSKNILFILSVF